MKYSVLFLVMSAATQASSFSDCYNEAVKITDKSTSLLICTKANLGFKDCFDLAKTSYYSQSKALRFCTAANANFSECHAKALSLFPGKVSALEACVLGEGN